METVKELGIRIIKRIVIRFAIFLVLFIFFGATLVLTKQHSQKEDSQVHVIHTQTQPIKANPTLVPQAVSESSNYNQTATPGRVANPTNTPVSQNNSRKTDQNSNYISPTPGIGGEQASSVTSIPVTIYQDPTPIPVQINPTESPVIPRPIISCEPIPCKNNGHICPQPMIACPILPE